MEQHELEKKAIVVVEDNEPIADLIKETLNTEPDYQAVVVNNGAQAIEVIKSVRASLILLDVGLPGLSGIEIYDLLQADPTMRAVPVVFLTAQSETRAFRERRFPNIIAKPFTLDQLLEMVARFCRPAAASNLDGRTDTPLPKDGQTAG
jgi:two-component system alkaline phosphatase synthesis response regulator PhoP